MESPWFGPEVPNEFMNVSLVCFPLSHCCLEPLATTSESEVVPQRQDERVRPKQKRRVCSDTLFQENKQK